LKPAGAEKDAAARPVSRRKSLLGWLGVAVTVLLSGFWAYWGAFENYHEGWYAETLLENLLMFLLQYMSIALAFTVLGIIAVRFKRLGLALHLLAGAGCVWFFRGAAFNVLGLTIVLPFAVLGLLHYFGEPTPRKWAYRLIVLIPLILATAITIPEGVKVSKRIDDGDPGIRLVRGNGVMLAWAPRGPGWPDRGVSWEEAQRICRFLSEDGTAVMGEEQNIWRLPTAEEAVRSLMLHGENAGGAWDAETETAEYDRTPDKESPLWDTHSKVIYYWTADTVPKNEKQAYIIVYNGGVYARTKTNSQAYLSFRAVKEAN
jgi:hypothetical protein